MPGLEAKDRMSPLQMAIVLILAVIGIHSDAMLAVIRDAGGATWLSLLLGGGLFCGVVLLIVKLGDLFPGQTLADYMPLLWGRWLGAAAILLLLVLVMLYTAFMLQGFSRIVSFFMFDRTPFEVIEASLLAVCVYCALQDWGTILRVMQLVFFTAMPAAVAFMGLSLVSFHYINILPLWPREIAGIARGVWHSWTEYSGYEVLLMLLPLVNRGTTRVSAVLVGAFAFLTIFFIFMAFLLIGIFTVEGAAKVPYPLLSAIRTADLPGTYLERLDTYFLLFWIQIQFAMFTIILYVLAQVPTRYFGYADHRPWVLALAPLLFMAGDALHSTRLYEFADQSSNWLGMLFSLGVIPASYGLARWKGQKGGGAGG
ncbi:MAG: GerAB/ArcD/ProY family transporter [Negativicutes bacterium]|nr:GerAB/ArcD/ProY family transporter [Negativicutes bacterium]